MRERDTTQPPALHDYLLGPANKSGGPFSRGQLLVNERGAQVVEVTLLTAMTWAAEPVFHPQLLLLH